MANSDGRLSSDAEAAGQTLPPTSIRAQLTRILQSQTFCNAPSLSRFLEFLVEKALEGKRDYLKEYSLGVEVFDRGPSFDPRTDTIVRVQARRLRAKLQDYYASEGRADPLVVELPKGHYVPLFRRTCVPEPGALVIPEARSEADLVGSSAPNGAVPNLNGRWASPVRYRAHLAAALVLAGTALAYFAGIRGSPTKSPSWTIRPLTSYSGHEGHASFSPDGSLVTFSYTARGNFDIHVRPVTGGDPIALTNHPADDTMPTWSPDGRYIAFLSDRGRGAYVYLVSPVGGDEIRLTATNLSRDQVVIHGLGGQPWSPDGRELLFTRFSPNQGTAIWKANLTTREEVQMTFPPQGSEDWDASWSFDGNLIVFERRVSGRNQLWVLPAQGGEPEFLINGGSWPCWSLDGTRILFSSNRSGAVNVWDVRVRSGELRRLTFGPGRDGHVAMAASGEVAFDHFQNEGSIYQMEVASKKGKQLTSHVSANFNARFSPDGKSILYQSNRSGDNEIWLFDSDTQKERRLTENAAEDTLPDWSPDGRQIVFRSNREGALHLWLMDAQGGSVRRLTKQRIPTPSPAMSATVTGVPWTLAPRWSPDGKLIGYLAAAEVGVSLWTVDPFTGGAHKASVSGQPLTFDWYRDHRHVVYVSSAPELDQREIRVANLDTGEQRILFRGPVTEIAVARDGSAMTFCKSESLYNQKLYLVALAASPEGMLPSIQSEPVLLTHEQGDWHAHNGDLSDDGKFAIFTQETVRSDIYVIDNYQP